LRWGRGSGDGRRILAWGASKAQPSGVGVLRALTSDQGDPWRGASVQGRGIAPGLPVTTKEMECVHAISYQDQYFSLSFGSPSLSGLAIAHRCLRQGYRVLPNIYTPNSTGRTTTLTIPLMRPACPSETPSRQCRYNTSPPPFLLRHLPPRAATSTCPCITLTWAQSLDAKIAGPGGARVILSGPQSMEMTHWSVCLLCLLESLSS